MVAATRGAQRKSAWLWLWWLCVTVGLACIVAIRWSSFSPEDKSKVDLVLVFVLLASALAPFLSEISMGGFTVKSQLASVLAGQSELERSVLALRAQILTVAQSQQSTSSSKVNVYGFGPQFYGSDEQISALRARQEEVLGEVQEVDDTGREESMIQARRSEEEMVLALRRNIEVELGRLVGDRKVTQKYSSPRVIEDLEHGGILTLGMGGYLRSIIALSEHSLVGTDLTETQKAFIRETGPKVLSVLKSVPA